MRTLAVGGVKPGTWDTSCREEIRVVGDDTGALRRNGEWLRKLQKCREGPGQDPEKHQYQVDTWKKRSPRRVRGRVWWAHQRRKEGFRVEGGGMQGQTGQWLGHLDLAAQRAVTPGG